MNKFWVLFLTLSGCAPHYHVFNEVESESINGVEDFKIFCVPKHKYFILTLNESTLSEVLLCSNTNNQNCVPMQKDTTKNGYVYELKIRDSKFHKLLKNDSLIIKTRVEDKWLENKFVPKEDRFIK